MNRSSDKPGILIVCGPTGIGKTAAAIALCRIFSGEIVSADSMQIYRLMEIGTAKPTPAERKAAPHHLIDFVDPDREYDARRYAIDARRVIDDLVARGILPCVAGGTGLYIKALTRGLFEAPKVDPRIREDLRRQAQRMGTAALHRRLSESDSEAARRIHPNDTFRILRALEVLESTGKPISAFQQAHRFGEAPYRTCKIGLHMAREALYARIDQRVDAMIAAGLLQEVEGLLARGYGPGLKAMQSIGYRHMCRYLQGEIDWAEAVRTLKRDTRRYAKRQMTWFQADDEIHWFGPDRIDEMAAVIKKNLL